MCLPSSVFLYTIPLWDDPSHTVPLYLLSCRHCSHKEEVRIERVDFERYFSGVLLQNAFPYLSASQRELMKTQICGTCWKKFFPEEE